MDRSQVEKDLQNLLDIKTYPCIAAVQAWKRKELLFDLYSGFGTGVSARALASQLVDFKKQQTPRNFFLTYMAVFPEDVSQDEEEFEAGLWRELSAMWEHRDIAGEWDPRFSANPDDKNFCFSLDGSAFFVVGLHPRSSRQARRLPYNALVFNLYDQFIELRRKGLFDSMAKTIRERDIQLQGSVNPMVETYTNTWESIQYSGRNNSPDWRCPFHKEKRDEKVPPDFQI